MHSLIIECDGGCSPNPGRGYGSYQITMNGKKGKIWRCDFGEGQTNNTSEYRILIRALEHILQHLNPIEVKIHIESDSRILIRFCASHKSPKRFRKTPPHFQIIKDELQGLLSKFHSVSSQWRNRDRSVEVFGH